MITFLYLRSALGIPVRLIGRPLDEQNPLPPAKMIWGHRKVEWMEQLTGTPFIRDDSRGALEARSELLAGRSIFASVDVPAAPAGRSRVIDLFGEPIRIASGLLRLAALTKVPLVPILGHSRGQRIFIAQEEPIPAGSEQELSDAVGFWIRKTLRRQPDQWWLWPFVVWKTMNVRWWALLFCLPTSCSTPDSSSVLQRALQEGGRRPTTAASLETRALGQASFTTEVAPTPLRGADGIACRTGAAFIAEAAVNRIRRLLPDGSLSTVSLPEELDGPTHLAFDAEGSLWVTATNGAALWKRTRGGRWSIEASNLPNLSGLVADQKRDLLQPM